MAAANAAAVAKICYRLRGIPLAIELAAESVKALTPEQIAARLDDHLRLLPGDNRTAPPRQQTFLSESEQVLLRRQPKGKRPAGRIIVSLPGRQDST